VRHKVSHVWHVDVAAGNDRRVRVEIFQADLKQSR